MLSVFGLMALCVAARVNDKTGEAVAAILDYLVWIAMIVIVFLCSAYLYFVCVAHAIDKNVAYRAERALESLLNGEDISNFNLFEKREYSSIWERFTVGGGGYWGWLFELLLLLAFSIITGVIVTS
jgi:hypothetical protein